MICLTGGRGERTKNGNIVFKASGSPGLIKYDICYFQGVILVQARVEKNTDERHENH